MASRQAACGFFGISLNTAPAWWHVDHEWLAGSAGLPVDLIDDGLWRTYVLTFSSPIGGPLHLMFEDYIGSGPAGDVYFDNVRFHDTLVPAAALPNAVPGPTSLMALVVAAVGAATRAAMKRRRPPLPAVIGQP